MTPNLLMKTLYGLSKIFDQNISDELVSIWSVVLGDLTDEELLKSVKAYCLDAESKYFPKPGQIYRLARPEMNTKEETAWISDQIFTSLRLYGTDAIGTERARHKIGEIGWAWIISCGGWASFVTSVISEEQVPTLKAQCRMALLGLMAKKKWEQENASNTRSLRDFGVVLKQIESEF
jgi:hypothetical protein